MLIMLTKMQNKICQQNDKLCGDWKNKYIIRDTGEADINSCGFISPTFSLEILWLVAYIDIR